MAFLCYLPFASYRSLSKLLSSSPSSFSASRSPEIFSPKLCPLKSSHANRSSRSVRLRFRKFAASNTSSSSLSAKPRQGESESVSISGITVIDFPFRFDQIIEGELKLKSLHQKIQEEFMGNVPSYKGFDVANNPLPQVPILAYGLMVWLGSAEAAYSSEGVQANMIYETGELFELGIQLFYLLLLLGLLGVGTFFVIRQVLVRRELDLSAKELQEQVRSGDASATEYFELGAVMLRRKFYPAAIKYLQQAIAKWDGDTQDLSQVYNALGVSFVREGNIEKGIAQFEKAVKLQPGYVTAWNNLGDAYEKKKDLRAALKAFEEVLLFDPNNKLARPRRDALKARVQLYKGVSLKSEER